MKRMLLLLCLLNVCWGNIIADSVGKDYMVIASERVMNDKEWNKVVEALQIKHPGAVMALYADSPREVLRELRKYAPRYVAIVEKPERLNADYVFDLNRLSREVDEDIYADFLWGIITGYDAEAALRMVEDTRTPLVVKDAISTITELSSGKWFDRYAWIDDRELGLVGEKKGPEGEIDIYHTNITQILSKFQELYEAYDPDLVVTASHATQNNLEMPFSLGNIKAKDGKLYADFASKKEFLKESGKRRVYLPIGNCLIADVNNTKESMAIAWMNSAHACAMIGYVVPTWYGRNGWGTLKYWLTTPGRYTLSEAFFLNQQDMLHQLNAWKPDLQHKSYFQENVAELTYDENGFFHDRDVVAVYGDPAWDVRLQQIPEENDFTVEMKRDRKKCIITIKTKDHFDPERMEGSHFKEEHVKNLPFSYFFPERLKNPRLLQGQDWKVALDENCLLIYDPKFEPGKTYQVILETR